MEMPDRYDVDVNPGWTVEHAVAGQGGVGAVTGGSKGSAAGLKCQNKVCGYSCRACAAASMS
jgi:hypothetical protein